MESLTKADLFLGPKGGKYTDAAHKHPWHPGQGETARQQSLFGAEEHRSAHVPLRDLEADHVHAAVERLGVPIANPHAHLHDGVKSGVQASQAGDKWVALTWMDYERKGDGHERFQRALQLLERAGFIVNRTRFGREADKVLVGAPEQSSGPTPKRAEGRSQLDLFKSARGLGRLRLVLRIR